jgi:hypothetical protein
MPTSSSFLWKSWFSIWLYSQYAETGLRAKWFKAWNTQNTLRDSSVPNWRAWVYLLSPFMLSGSHYLILKYTISIGLVQFWGPNIMHLKNYSRNIIWQNTSTLIYYYILEMIGWKSELLCFGTHLDWARQVIRDSRTFMESAKKSLASRDGIGESSVVGQMIHSESLQSQDCYCSG